MRRLLLAASLVLGMGASAQAQNVSFADFVDSSPNAIEPLTCGDYIPVTQNSQTTRISACDLASGGTTTLLPGNAIVGKVSQVDSAGGDATDTAHHAVNVNVVAGGAVGGTSSTFGASFPGTGTAMGLKNGANMVNATADGSGNLNVNIAAGAAAGGTSSNFASAFPGPGTAIGVKNGANMVNLTADGSNNLNVNCAVGCSAGATSNASSGVATSSTNNPGVSYNYGFNGTTWDQLQVDASKFLKVILQSGSTSAVTQATASNLNATVVGTGTFATQAAQSGTWTVQPGNTPNTSPWLVTETPATSGGLSSYILEPAATDNHAVIKNGAGQVFHIATFNNSATINYMRLYNAGTGFNGCNSASNLIWEGHIPASTSDAGFVEPIPEGLAFSTGISICVTGAYGQTNTTAATASAISVDIFYK